MILKYCLRCCNFPDTLKSPSLPCPSHHFGQDKTRAGHGNEVMDIRQVIEECRSEIQAASEDGNEYDEGDLGGWENWSSGFRAGASQKCFRDQWEMDDWNPQRDSWIVRGVSSFEHESNYVVIFSTQ